MAGKRENLFFKIEIFSATSDVDRTLLTFPCFDEDRNSCSHRKEYF